MTNEHYQRLFSLNGRDLRDHLVDGADPAMGRLCADETDDDLAHLVQNLGGHDLAVLTDRYRRCDAVTDRPSVVFAYTVKGWGLPLAGNPMNHAALLSEAQVDDLRASVGLDPDQEWDRFDAESAAGRLCDRTGAELNNVPPLPRPRLRVPPATAPEARGPASTQEAFGRVLTTLGRDPEVAARLVTTSPDVSVSTNLGGWINQQGVFAPEPVADEGAAERVLAWRQGPGGRHLELGISEMNLFLLLSQLGLSHDHHGEALLPIGTVYDPFVCRGLDALVYALYNDARFVVVGTPSGISLAPEGGAHQSTITASIGVELPGLTFAEPAYGPCLDWLLCDGLARLSEPDGRSLYLRLSTRPIDPAPFLAARDRLGEERLRNDVLAGGYRLVEPDDSGRWPGVVLAASGAVMPEVVETARLLREEEVASVVLDITSLGRLYTGWRQSQRRAAQQALAARPDHHLARLLAPAERNWPIVTVHDASSHAMAWLGSVFGARTVPVGVDDFGQSGTISELYGAFDLLPEQLVNAALVSLA